MSSWSSSCRPESVNVEDGRSKIEVLDMGHEFFLRPKAMHIISLLQIVFFVSF